MTSFTNKVQKSRVVFFNTFPISIFNFIFVSLLPNKFLMMLVNKPPPPPPIQLLPGISPPKMGYKVV